MSIPDPLERILLVTPYAWNVPHPVNDHVADLADALAQAREDGVSGMPAPVVVAPASSGVGRRFTRRALRDLARGMAADEVLARDELRATMPGERRPSEAAYDWPVLSLPVPVGPASVSMRANVRVLLDRLEPGLVHVHDPLANDLVRFVVRQWAGLTVATHHCVPPAVLGALTAPLRERVVAGVDRWLVRDEPAAVAAFAHELGLTVTPAPVPVAATASADAGVTRSGPVIVVGRGGDDDAIVRDLVRDLAPLLDARPDLSLTMLARWSQQHRPTTPRSLRGRLRAVDAPTREQADAVLAGAGLYIASPQTHPRGREEAIASRVPVLDLPTRDEQDSGDVEALHVRIEEMLSEAASAPQDALPTPTRLAAAHLEQYGAVRERVQVHIAPPTASQKNCVIDLHMHTSHSWDCATDPEALLHVAREVGLTAIAVTDHNEISGALECATYAEEYGIQVIVGEEVKTSQGEVIGLFLSERIEAGLSWHETIERIRAQDGLVYVPHPFDRLHTIPDVHLLRDTLDEIDAFETYNARLPFEQYNRDAERFARKYNLIEGAGSDAHVPQGLGTAAVHMPAWDDKESFLVALSQGEILRRPKSLLYLQGLKWVNDLTGRSKRLPEAAHGPDR